MENVQRVFHHDESRPIKRFKVSATTKVHSLAGFVLFRLQNEGKVELVAMGPHAINNSVKAISIARKHTAEYGFDIAAYPEYIQVKADEDVEIPSSSVKSSDGSKVEGVTEIQANVPEENDLNTRTAIKFLLQATSGSLN